MALLLNVFLIINEESHGDYNCSYSTIAIECMATQCDKRASVTCIVRAKGEKDIGEV
jgi:hypothetical protein